MSQPKTKIMVFTAMWKRAEVARIFAEGMKRFIAAAPSWIEVEIFAVISETYCEEICKEYGIHYIIAPNNPLGKKWNTGMAHCLENHQFDYALIMGDDDLIANKAWPYFAQMIQAKEHYFGFSDLYFYSPKEKKALIFKYDSNKVHKDKLVGCGSMISRVALEKSGYHRQLRILQPLMTNRIFDRYPYVPEFQAQYFIGMKRAMTIGDKRFMLWSDEQNTGLDNEREVKLLLVGFEPKAIPTPNPLMIDIKTEMNIWGFQKWESMCQEVKTEEALRITSAKERKLLNQITY
jgi:hypothetical protein